MRKQNKSQFYNYLYINFRNKVLGQISGAVSEGVRSEFLGILYNDLRYNLYSDLSSLD